MYSSVEEKYANYGGHGDQTEHKECEVSSLKFLSAIAWPSFQYSDNSIS